MINNTAVDVNIFILNIPKKVMRFRFTASSDSDDGNPMMGWESNDAVKCREVDCVLSTATHLRTVKNGKKQRPKTKKEIRHRKK